MKCHNCGMENKNDALFCENCGLTLTKKQNSKNNKFKYIIICIIITVILMIAVFAFINMKDESDSTTNNKQYSVVQITKDDDIESLFLFTSVEQTNITDASYSGIQNGTYSLGVLSNGHSVFWFSDDDGTENDDCLFIYVEKKLKTAELISYIDKLDEDPITYQEFLKLYSQYEKDEISQIMEDITKKLEDKKYDDIVDFFKEKRSHLNNSIYYYQNGRLVNELSTGHATILMENGIYVGEIKNEQRYGEGMQFGIYTNDYSYTVVNGTWKNDKLNGYATYYEPNISVLSSKSESLVDFTYEGNFTDNYYDGNIKATWKSKTGTYTSTFEADMGKITVLRQEDEKYIYLDDGNGYYWYFTDSTALEGWKVWDGRDSK